MDNMIATDNQAASKINKDFIMHKGSREGLLNPCKFESAFHEANWIQTQMTTLKIGAHCISFFADA